MRVGSKQKQIDIDIPKLSEFIHRTYVYVSRKIYKNVYLFDVAASPIDKQKNVRELELMIRESILEVIRDGMPIERILRAYLDKTIEEDTFEVREEIQTEEIEPEIVTAPEQPSQTTDVTDQSTEKQSTSLGFNNTDLVKNYDTTETPNSVASATVVQDVKPKTIDILEQISEQRFQARRDEESDDDSDDDSDDGGFVIQHKFMKPSNEVLEFDTFDIPSQSSQEVKKVMPVLDVEEL
jgi:hypothetical protein